MNNTTTTTTNYHYAHVLIYAIPYNILRITEYIVYRLKEFPFDPRQHGSKLGDH